jgi:hypothetical protein
MIKRGLAALAHSAMHSDFAFNMAAEPRRGRRPVDDADSVQIASAAKGEL